MIKPNATRCIPIFYLCKTPEEDAQVLAERLGRTFGFVGLQNLYGLSHQIFFAANGASLQPTQRLNAMDEKSDPVANFSHLNELIEARNSKDMTIYLHFERLYKNYQEKMNHNASLTAPTEMPACRQASEI